MSVRSLGLCVEKRLQHFQYIHCSAIYTIFIFCLYYTPIFHNSYLFYITLLHDIFNSLQRLWIDSWFKYLSITQIIVLFTCYFLSSFLITMSISIATKQYKTNRSLSYYIKSYIQYNIGQVFYILKLMIVMHINH